MGEPTLVEPSSDVFKAYVARKRSRALLDFDDLLLYWRAAGPRRRLGRRLAGAVRRTCWSTSTRTSTSCRSTSSAACCAGGAGLTAVGDDAQAVYGFRGASARHILDLPAQLPGTTVVRLVRNYRSTQPILDLANAAWAGAAVRYAQGPALAVRAGGVRPGAGRLRATRRPRPRRSARRVLAARERGSRLRDQAVLFRAGRGSDLLELELTRRRIPYVKYGGLRYLEAAHVKDLLALYRLADNPRDETAWFRLLRLLDGVGPATARRVVDSLDLDRDGVLDRWDAAGAARVRAGRRRPAGGRDLAALTGAAGSRRRGAERAEACGRAGAGGPGRATRTPRRGWPTWSGCRRRPPSTATCATFVVELALDPPRVDRRRRGAAERRRGLAGAVHGALGQGPGVGRGAPAARHRGQLPVGPGRVHRGRAGRGAAAVPRRADPGPRHPAPLRAAALPPPPAGPGRPALASPSAAGSSTRPRWPAATGSAPEPETGPVRGARRHARPRRPGRSRPSSTRSGSSACLGTSSSNQTVLPRPRPSGSTPHRSAIASTRCSPRPEVSRLPTWTSCGRRWLESATPTRIRPAASRTVRTSSSRVCRIALDTSSVVSSAAVSSVSSSTRSRSRSVTSQRATLALSAVGRQRPPQRRAGRGPVADQLPDQQHGVVRRRRVHQPGQRVGQLRPARRPAPSPTASSTRCSPASVPSWPPSRSSPSVNSASALPGATCVVASRQTSPRADPERRAAGARRAGTGPGRARPAAAARARPGPP